jgi:nitrate/nitrite-specific signal transduction histidine kinase
LIRAAGYWFLFALAILQLTLIFQIASAPDQDSFVSYLDLGKLWQDHRAVAISGLMMLPIVLIDTAFISNRVVGPLVRIRRNLQQMAAGEIVEPLAFRKNDFLQELSAAVNDVAARMNRLNEQADARCQPDAESHEQPAIIG